MSKPLDAFSYERLVAAAEARELDRQLDVLYLMTARADTPELRKEIEGAYSELLSVTVEIVHRMVRAEPSPMVIH